MADAAWMAEAIGLGEAARGTTAPNPAVGCIIVSDGAKVGEGATGAGGRPHAEWIALAQAGERARGATAYVTLEPCAHASPRGPACADALVNAGVSHAVVAVGDPDPRVNGSGLARLCEAGVEVTTGLMADEAEVSLGGFLARIRFGRPRVTLKLAMSIDGQIALASGKSRWITGEDAREDVHRQRARSDMIWVGSGTYEADAPRLNVRIAGLEARSPRRAMLTRGAVPDGWEWIADPRDIHRLDTVNDLFVEGGAGAAAAFLAADLVDCLLVYRAPILIGDGKAAIGGLGLAALADAHGRWRALDSRMLGSDRLEVYERVRN